MTLSVFGVVTLFSSGLYAASITIQPEAIAGKDVSIGQYVTHSTAGEMYVLNNYSSSTLYSLIEFDLSIVPVGATINSAVMEIFLEGSIFQGIPANYLINAYRITSNWNETSITWATQPPLDFTVPVANSGGTPNNNTWVVWDITNFVNDWYLGVNNNYGVELRNSGEGTYYYFTSSDSAASSLHPKLTIEYTSYVIPEPATFLLLGMGILAWVRRRSN